jgi:hypothetical protein
MAATVQIHQYTGTAGTPITTNVTSGSIRAGTSDEPISASNIPVPSSGSNYSYWVSEALECTVAPDNAINNIKWYSDGSNGLGTGVSCVIASASVYVQASGTSGSSGLTLTVGNHSGINSSGASPFTDYTSGSPLSLSGSIGATTGCIGDRWLVWQIQVVSTAGAGNTGAETWTWQYDES